MLFIHPAINPKSQPSIISSFIYTTFPTGIGFLAGYLRGENSANIRIIDEHIHNFTDDMLVEEIKKLAIPKIVGISCLTINSKRALELAEKIKQIDPEVVTVLGGVHPTVLPEECLQKKGVDIVVRGEGENTLSELYGLIKNGKDFWHIKGISYKGDGKIIHNPGRELISNLNDIPPFPYDLFEKEIEKYRDFGTIITSRGCPYRCIFCSQRAISGGRYRFLSTERVLEELDLLVFRYKQKAIWFNEDNFAVNRKRLDDLLDAIIERKYNREIQFIAELRADGVDTELLKKLRQANFTMLSFGAETGSERLMKVIKKGETVEDNNRAIRMAHEAGIKPTTTYIFGLPTETRRERLETFRLSQKLPLDNVRFNTAIPYPGTELYEMARREGKLKILEDWQNFNVQYYIISDDIPYVPTGVNRYVLIYDTMMANLRTYISFKGLKSILTSPLSGGGVITMPKDWSLKDIVRILRFGFFVFKRFAYILIRVLLYKLSRCKKVQE
ncbi:B12-binding domain-containing radical SAM protein [bacterium]|nr:B12-binding domain-containing radical SAM protein [bacterium]